MPKILIIDDSEVIHNLLGDFFDANGFDVFLAETADRAYAFLKKDIPDVILLDIQLPDVGGMELCKLFRRKPETRSVPIIMITATATQVDDKVKGLQAGADDYIVKPFEMSELLERVRAVLRRTAASTPQLVPSASVTPEIPVTPPVAAVRETIPSPREIIDACLMALFAPRCLLDLKVLPNLVVPFLGVMIAVLLVSLLAASGVGFKPSQVLLIAMELFLQVALVLSIAGSFAGLSLKWKESMNLVSYAGLPLLFKLMGAGVLSLTTTLSPFLYSAGPALFFKDAPFWLYRLDLFELWSVYLLWCIIARKNAGGRMVLVVGGVWASTIVVLFALHRLRS